MEAATVAFLLFTRNERMESNLKTQGEETLSSKCAIEKMYARFSMSFRF